MKNFEIERYPDELSIICDSVRDLVFRGDYGKSMEVIAGAMEQFPHAPHPHNLMGIVLEKQGDHFNAMKHFRASYALDPSYTPSTYNLNMYGTFFSGGSCAFDEYDVLSGAKRNVVSENKGFRITRIRSDNI